MDPQATTPQQSDDEAIKFVDELIDQKFAEHKAEVTEEVRKELRQDLFLRLDNFMMSRILAALSDEDLVAFEGLVKEGKSREELQKFAAEHIRDFTTLASNAFLEFRTVYLGS